MREKSFFMGESEQVWITDLCLNINFYVDTKVLLKHIKQQFFYTFLWGTMKGRNKFGGHKLLTIHCYIPKLFHEET